MAGNRSLGRLTLDLVARIGGFTQGMSQAERIAQDRSRRIQRTFSNLQRSVTGIFAAIGAGALVRSIVRATAEAEESLALLNNAVEQNGGAAGRTTQQLAAMASELQRTTKFSDDAVMGAEQLLLRFQSIQDVNFDRALQSTLDLATALGTDLDAAAKLVGKALESPVKGLTQLERSGVVLDKSQRDLVKRLVETGQQAQAQQALLDGLEKRYKGAATAARDTFGGALAGVKNAFDDLLEAKGGLPEATAKLNELADTFSDPQFVQNIGIVTSALVTGFGAAAKFIADTTGLVKFIGEEFASAVHGPAADDVVRINEEIADTTKEIQKLKDMGGFRKWLWGGEESVDAIIAEEEKRIQKYQRMLEDFRASATTGPAAPAGNPTPVAAGPSEEFLKLEASLREQIALFGKVGEAAKIAYQIQSGELDELSTKEQQRVLSLARQYDGMVKAAEAAKEQEAAQKQLQQSYDAQQDSFLRQIYLTEEATELERLRYEINNGGLQGITQANREFLEILAQEVDELRERKQLEAELAAVIEETLTPLEKYQRRIEELNELMSQGLSYDVYVKAVKLAQDELEKATNESNEFLLEAARNTQDILADTLFGAMEGKIDNIGAAFLKMLNQMIAQALAAQLAEKLFGADMKGGGWLDSAIGFTSGFFGGGKAGGGHAAAGMLYRVNEKGMEGLSIPGREDYLMMGSRGGQVVPAGQVGRGGVTVTQNIAVQGRVDQRSSAQIAMDTSRRLRLAQRLS
jgi:hypothetical protein